MLPTQINGDSGQERYFSLRHPSWEESDHLTYLKRRDSIFENEDVKKIGGKNLICANCKHPITKVSEQIEIYGRHDHTFTNLGYVVRLGCFRNAPGCAGVQRVSHGYSWFRGYAWQIQVCESCFTQLGWKYMTKDESFYGLVFNTLREEETEEDREPTLES